MRRLLHALALLSLTLTAAADGAPRKLSIERLYSLPWVIGTSPAAPTWSPDSQHLAFLWNDDGGNFYDVWMTDVNSARPVRVTQMPRRPMPPASGRPVPAGDIDALAEVERAENDRGVSAVLWTADSSHVIFSFHGQLYEVSPGQAPRRLAESNDAQSEAAAAPKGNRIAYLSAGDLWVLELGDKPMARRVYAPGRDGVIVESLYWSADGQQLAFVETDLRQIRERQIPDYLADETRTVAVKRAFPGEPSESRRVGIVSASGGTVQWADLGAAPFDQIFSVAFSPDGKALLVDTSDLYIKDRRLLRVNPSTGHSTLMVREVDPKNVTAEWWAGWAPDSKGVYFISDRDNDYHLYYQPLSGGAPKRLTRGASAVFSAAVSGRAAAVFFIANPGNPEERQLFRMTLRGGTPQRLTTAAGNHDPLLSPDGRWVADLFSNDVTPPDLYLLASNQAEAARQVTHSPLAEFSDYRWVAARYVSFPNVHDGTLLHARLTLPPDFDPARRYPAILGSVYSNTAHNRWGGRIYHPTWGIDQYLAQQGYVIMNVDISGSSGYGKAFRQRIGEDYGGDDVEDLYSGVQYLIGQGFVDAQRVGIWGSSYGGLLTTMSLFKKPGVYQAGVAGAPATSLFHAETGEMRTMMAPQDHRQQYAASSAFLQSRRLQDHLLIIHGMKDDVVLFKDSISLTQRLILQGGDVDLVVLPNSPHGWDTEGLAQTRFAYRKLAEYFRTYLGEGASP